jgi:hypothetical protein
MSRARNQRFPLRNLKLLADVARIHSTTSSSRLLLTAPTAQNSPSIGSIVRGTTWVVQVIYIFSKLTFIFQMFEGAFSPPVYNDLYNFLDGPQDDIFENSYSVIPDPAPNAALPVLAVPSAATPSSTTASDTTAPSSSSTPAPNQKANTWFVSILLLYCHVVNLYSAWCSKRKPSSSALAARSLGTEGSTGHRLSIFRMTGRSRKLQPGKRGSLWHMF